MFEKPTLSGAERHPSQRSETSFAKKNTKRKRKPSNLHQKPDNLQTEKKTTRTTASLRRASQGGTGQGRAACHPSRAPGCGAGPGSGWTGRSSGAPRRGARRWQPASGVTRPSFPRSARPETILRRKSPPKRNTWLHFARQNRTVGERCMFGQPKKKKSRAGGPCAPPRGQASNGKIVAMQPAYPSCAVCPMLGLEEIINVYSKRNMKRLLANLQKQLGG